MNRSTRILGLLVAVLLAWLPATAQESTQRRSAPWSNELLDMAQRLPVQDGGRIKPLSTFAGFTLLRLNGVRNVKTPSGEKLTPTAWLLDVMFFPEQAQAYASFIVQNAEAIEAIGLAHDDKKKRDRYSLAELRPGIPKLMTLAHEYGAIEEKARTGVQNQIVNLAENVLTFTRLARYLDFAQARIGVESDAAFAPVFPGQTTLRFHDLVEKAPQLRSSPDTIARLGQVAGSMASSTGVLVFMPPIDNDPEWWTPAETLRRTLEGGTPAPEHVTLLRHWQTLDDQRTDPAAFEREFASMLAVSTRLTEARGEYDNIGLEVSYYRLDPLHWALLAFVLAFVAAAILWLKPQSTTLYTLTWGSALVATLLVVVAITLRCVIRERPPVSTLYETVLFVTGVGAVVALVMELLQRQRIAVSAAAFVGLVGLFIANGYETLDKKDTMPSLVAVLDTNFWLATHVTSITIGYSAGMLAAVLASIWILAKTLGLKRAEPAFFKSLGRMTYGVLCFGVIFATVGTILGGIWANDSWGRFWGWDPKENGALLIVISQLVILHGRMGGFLRDFGIAIAAAFSGTIVAFSWWGVNLLGVGLHSYGFTSGIQRALWIYYGIQWGVCLLGFYALLRERSAAREALPAAVERKEHALQAQPVPFPAPDPRTASVQR